MANVIVKKYKKDPDSILDYPMDWSDWLETGDSISTAVWTVPAGLTKTDEIVASPLATIWLSGGSTTPGTRYEVVCHITTAAGREDDRAFLFTMI